jgi:hypothetical protein
VVFKRATQRNLRVRILIDGVSGSGKTRGSLEIASGLAGEDGRIGLIDTQNRQSRRYASRYRFGVADMRADFSPEAFIAEIDSAQDQKIDVLIVDSASHEWDAVLGIVDSNATGWKGATPRHKAFVEALLQYPGHVIVTCRTKTAWEYKANDRGRIQPYRVGTDIEQRPKFEYDFDVWLRLDMDHSASVEKSAIDVIEQGSLIASLDTELGERIRAWSEGDAVVSPKETAKSRTSGSANGAASSTTDTSRAPSTDDDVEDEDDVLSEGMGDGESWGDDQDDASDPQNASQTPPQRQQAASRRQNGSEDAAPTTAPRINANGKPEQCDVCGTKIYPNVEETAEGSTFMGSTLIRVTRERFGRVLCVTHWLTETRKARQRDPKRSPARP